MSIFLKYEDCAVKINNSGIFATDATFSMDANVQVERLIDGSILKDSLGEPRYGATSPIKGQLSLTYYMDDNFSNFFDIFSMGEESVTGTFAGVEIQGMYLTSTSFSVEPFAAVPMSVTFDVYGPITSSSLAASNISLTQNEVSLLNGATSFVSGSGIDGKIDHVQRFDYNATAQRTPSYHIGENAPSRVSIDTIDVQMSVDAEKFGDDLSVNGNEARLNVTMRDLYDNTFSREFGCTGRIISQQLSASSQGYLQGNISVTQAFR
tara:strand:+ start:968 stop:1762 length:795 start_codon:yes stop_codon:yes gene_type:complete